MTDDNPKPTRGETLEELIERVSFADPVTHKIRAEWEATKREVEDLFQRACSEKYEDRLTYHLICETPDPEQQAKADVSALRILLMEERDRRLAGNWEDILRRVKAVLDAKPDRDGESTG